LDNEDKEYLIAGEYPDCKEGECHLGGMEHAREMSRIVPAAREVTGLEWMPIFGVQN
jgi:hypothetical protein